MGVTATADIGTVGRVSVVVLVCGWLGVAAIADIGRLAGCVLLHQIGDRIFFSGWIFPLLSES